MKITDAIIPVALNLTTFIKLKFILLFLNILFSLNVLRQCVPKLFLQVQLSEKISVTLTEILKPN